MKPEIHAKSSARKYGGITSDYLPIHQFMDSTKSTIADNRHRAILHSSFGIFIAEKVFGMDLSTLEKLKETYNLSDECVRDIIEWKQKSQDYGTCMVNSDGKQFSVRDIGEQHVMEDFGNRFIPSAADYLGEMEYKSWMNNKPGCVPDSFKKINNKKEIKTYD